MSMTEEPREDMAPGDEVTPEADSSGENVCPVCTGSGRVDGQTCERCGGTGRVEEAVGGG